MLQDYSVQGMEVYLKTVFRRIGLNIGWALTIRDKIQVLLHLQPWKSVLEIEHFVEFVDNWV